jgi:hypothetical protein
MCKKVWFFKKKAHFPRFLSDCSENAVSARFPECRVIRRLGLAVVAALCHLLLAAVLRYVKNFWAGMSRLVQADQAPVTILE